MSTLLRNGLSITLLLGLALGACRRGQGEPGPAPEHYRGSLSSGCAPNDAVSTVLQLESTRSSDSATFDFWPSRGVSLPAVIRFGAGRAEGQGVFCTVPESCEPAEWGEVTLAEASEHGGTSGEWTLGMADGRLLRGTYEAEWLAIQAICG